jgi:hypothetical protein
MEERSLLELANKLREERGLVAYVDLNENSVKVLNADSTTEFTSIKSEEEVSDDSIFSRGRTGSDLIDPAVLGFSTKTFSDGDQELSEIVMLMFCDDISKDCLMGGVYVKDNSIRLFSEEAVTKAEVQIIISKIVEEEKQKVQNQKHDLTMLHLANDLRREYGMIAYSLDQGDKHCVVVKLVDRKKDVELIQEKPKGRELERYLLHQKGSVSALDHMDVYGAFFDNCFPDAKISEYNLLLFCDRVSNYLQIGEIYLDKKVIYVLGKPFSNKNELLTALPAIVKEELVKEQRSALQELAELAYNYDYVQDGRAVILDGVAYVADTSSTLLYKHGSYYLEGYLANGKVVWSRVDKNRFRPINVETDGPKEKEVVRQIHLLETLYYSDLYIVYRSIVKGEEKIVIRSPYPVAILEDGEFAYYFETKPDAEVAKKESMLSKLMPKWRGKELE